MKLFRVFAYNGDHIAICGDFETAQEAKDFRLQLEDRKDREDQTWFDVVPLMESLAPQREKRPRCERGPQVRRTKC
jgi:hypothetical protein